MWSNQLSSGRITLQLKRFLFHIYNGAREEFISFPCRSYCAAWLFGLSAGDGAEQKWMILACISQPHYRPKCRAAVVCAIIYKTNHFLPIKRESTKESWCMRAQRNACAQKCCVFSCSASLAHFGLHSIVYSARTRIYE
jgi:hypothetical protein